jgi:transposase-like protein
MACPYCAKYQLIEIGKTRSSVQKYFMARSLKRI